MSMKNTEIGYFPEAEHKREDLSRFLRLKQAVKNAGGLAHVAVAANVGTTTLSGYMNGREWKIGIAEQIAQACDVDLQWLLFGDQPNACRNEVACRQKPLSELMHIPGYDIELSVGHGISSVYAEESVSFQISTSLLPEHLKTRSRRLVSFTVRGDSMEPVIFSGDSVVFDLMDKDIFTGGVYALRVGDQLLVKRLSLRANGNLLVMSDNPRYPTDEINAQEAQQIIRDGSSPVQVVGRVVWRSGGLFTE
ncbi:hypothetical protein GCM10022398_26410 [Acetobacter lovaniensis]|jgi:phage repressor protein C with HTH and peptisase S24 domain|uniref:LexA family transcriptional regulator n=2 Tax=Acetobacter TaxID=434 RepID=UPI0016B8BE31|nr:S24 family peptidase [Acetobacter lovaniensis]MCP1238872.1 LexA family transcriptional regulator [Acetobacter lovaniensis]NHN80920.1 LexA family transcriptional regulator [Acetobacter lovaniensis]GBQ62666.1 putative transcriptional regulator [Acetobacter lovaniensis NRIC 0474]